MPGSIIELILRHDAVELARVNLPAGEYVIGRSQDAQIFVNTPLISRLHARLIIDHDSIVIEDLGSSNGTFVADLPIEQPTYLSPEHEVRLGDIVLEIRRQRSLSQSAPTQSPKRDVIRRLLPDELLAAKRHTVGKVVAKGGMGAILDAQQTATKRNVAMKVMLETADEGDVLRFIEEAQVTAQLEHPNIVPVHELGVDEQDQLFYTMKMVRGITLKKILELLRNGVAGTVKKYQLPALLTVFQKACDAIAFAHSKGVIHRDLKPDNIMIGDFGEVLVMDWGLAKVIGKKEGAPQHMRTMVMSARAAEADFGNTLAGTIMGTPYYMAPEQARGEVETLDARADIYALGAILFELLYLRHPVTGESLEVVLENVRQGVIDWPNPRQSIRQKEPSHLPGGRAPDSLLAVCRKALALDPDERYARVDEFQADLEAYQHGFATSAEKTSPLKNFWLLVQRRKIESIAAALVFIAVTGFGTQAVIAGRQAARALADLKSNAPSLLQLAESEALVQKFDSALLNASAALKLDPQLHAARWRQAWIHLGLGKWNEAAEALRDAAQRDSGKRFLANGILPVAERLAAAAPRDGQAATPDEAMVIRYLENVGAAGEVTKFTSRFASDAEKRRQVVVSRLEKTLGKGAFSTELFGPFKWVAARGFNRALTSADALRGLPLDVVSIEGTKITDLSPLQGIALKDLNINVTTVTDLAPLHGMPLATLRMNGTKITDLSPLTGAPLSVFSADTTGPAGPLSDLTPLNGAPLKELRIGNSNVYELPDLSKAPLEILNAGGSKLTSIENLRGKPVRDVSLGGTSVRDLTPLTGTPLARLSLETSLCGDFSPLRGCPLEVLSINYYKGTDLTTLRGLPIKSLDIYETRGVKDWTFLLDLPQLERIRCSKIAPLMEVVRRHPTLLHIDCSLFSGEPTGSRPVVEFWAAFDEHTAGAAK